MAEVSSDDSFCEARLIMTYKTLYALAVLTLTVATIAGCTASPQAPSTTPTTTPTVPAGTFAGRALQAGTSNPIVSAVVTMFEADGPVTTTTDASGAFSFSGLAAGASALQVTATGFVASSSTVTVPQSNYVVMLVPVGAPTAPALLSVAVTGNAVLTAGQTSQLTAATVRSDGVQTIVTPVAKWVSSAPAVATVSSAGLVTAHAAGQAVITASFREVSGGLAVSVNIP